MTSSRVHVPSLLLGGLLSLIAAAAAARSPESEISRFELEISENNGQRYLLERDTGRLFLHQGDAWVQAAPAPE